MISSLHTQIIELGRKVDTSRAKLNEIPFGSPNYYEKEKECLFYEMQLQILQDEVSEGLKPTTGAEKKIKR